jgi:hypothetical protein
MNHIFMAAVIQEHSFIIRLGKWWQVLLILIALIGIVWLIAKISESKQP